MGIEDFDVLARTDDLDEAFDDGDIGSLVDMPSSRSDY